MGPGLERGGALEGSVGNAVRSQGRIDVVFGP